MQYSGRVNIEHLLRSRMVREVVTTRANVVAAAARVGAPRRTGAFMASIHVVVDSHGGVRHDRVVARVVASVPHASAVEFGNSSTPRGHFTLRRALQVG